MRNLLLVMIATLCLAVLPPQAHAAKANKAKGAAQSTKEKLVLMPLRVPEEDKNLIGAMETALVEGLQQKYVVFSGEQVAQKAREIFMKESRNTAKKDCDETRCMQNIAEAFQAELIATANVSKQEGGYFLALSIQNIFDNKVEYSKSTPCKGCDAFQVVDKLKELSGAPAQSAPQSSSAAAKPEAPIVPSGNASAAETSLWNGVRDTNRIDDYETYLSQYPNGKYSALAQSLINKLKGATEQREQQVWDKTQQENSEESYSLYLKSYPTGRFAGIAKVRNEELKNDIPARTEARMWEKAESSNDKYAIEAYLNRYPNGRHIAAASAKLKPLEEADHQREQTKKEQISYVSQGGLTWMPVTFPKTWAEANSYCANTTINGQRGWRLPTKDELYALYDSGAMIGQGWVLNYTWSSTPRNSRWGREDHHYLVFLNTGLVLPDSDTYNIYVTCVR